MNYSDVRSRVESLIPKDKIASIVELTPEEINIINDHLETLDDAEKKIEIGFLLDYCLDYYSKINLALKPIFAKYVDLLLEIKEESKPGYGKTKQLD